MSEYEIREHGAEYTLDLNLYKGNSGGGGEYFPRTPIDVFKAIIPIMSSAMGVIKRNFGAYPKYLLTGINTAAMLRAIQDMVASIPDMRGEIGFNGGTAQFLKLKILESFYLEDDIIYLSTKADQGSPEYSTILDLVYQPLYIVKETTDGNARHFVRSRTLVKIVRTDGLATIKVQHLSNFLGRS